MYEITDCFREGGEFMYLLLMLAVPAALLGTGLAIATALKARVPAPAWLLFPALLLAVGALGAWSGAEIAVKAIASATPDEAWMMATFGYAVALYPDVFGLLAGGATLTLTALVGGLATLAGSGGEGSRWRPGIGIAVAGAALVVGAGVAVWSLARDAGPGPLLIGVSLALGGLGCGLGALRLPGGDGGEERAGAARVFLGLCALGGVLCAVVAGELAGEVALYKTLVTAAPEARESFAASARNTSQTASLLGWVAAPTMLLLTLAVAAPGLGRLRTTRTLLSGLIALALLAPVGAVRAGASMTLDELRGQTEVARLMSLPGYLEDLPHARLPEGLEPTWLAWRPDGWALDWSSDGWEVLFGPTDSPTLPLEPAPGPALLVPGEAAASALAGRRVDQDGRVDLTLKLSPDAPTTIEGWPTGLVSLELELLPPGEPLRDLELERRTFDPELHRVVLVEGAVDDPIASLRAHDAPRWHQLVVVPAAAWTVQDVVTFCLVARSLAGHDDGEGGRFVRCTLAAELLAPEPPLEVWEEPEEPELIDGPGGLGDLAQPPDEPQRLRGSVSLPEPTEQDPELGRSIVRTMRRYSGRFKACYERQLRVQPALNGKVTLEFQIEPSGRVINASVSSSTMGDAALEECLRRSIERARFPPFDGEEPVSISYPLIFQAQ